MDATQALRAGKIVNISFLKCRYDLTFGGICEVDQVVELAGDKEVLRCTIDNVAIYLKSEELENFVSLEEYEKIKKALDYFFYQYDGSQIENMIKRRKKGVNFRGKVVCLNILKPETLEFLYKQRKKQESVNEIVVDLHEKNDITEIDEEELSETFEQIDKLTKVINLRIEIDAALDKKDKVAFIDLTKKLKELEKSV